jgi:UDP-N-acetyl-D-galactosamine dehydrogenase
VYDPQAAPEEAQREYGITITDWNDLPRADALVLAVAHESLLRRPVEDLLSKVAKGGCVVDVKARLPREAIEDKGHLLWRL